MRAVNEKLIINKLGPNCRSGGTEQQMKHTAHGVGVQHINITVISCDVNSEYLSIFTAHAPSINLKHVKSLNITSLPGLPCFYFFYFLSVCIHYNTQQQKSGVHTKPESDFPTAQAEFLGFVSPVVEHFKMKSSWCMI